MTSTTILAVCLTMICLASVATTLVVIWWTMDSGGQHSISARHQVESAQRAMERMIGQSAAIVGSVTGLTETLLLGRPLPPTSPPPVSESPSEIPLTPDDVWNGLPDTIRWNLVREAEEAATWPSPSEQLQQDSEPEPEPR
jgi:hypothetical protein